MRIGYGFVHSLSIPVLVSRCPRESFTGQRGIDNTATAPLVNWPQRTHPHWAGQSFESHSFDSRPLPTQQWQWQWPMDTPSEDTMDKKWLDGDRDVYCVLPRLLLLLCGYTVDGSLVSCSSWSSTSTMNWYLYSHSVLWYPLPLYSVNSWHIPQ